MLPFTVDDFFDVFSAYNEAIWPAQILAYALAALVLWMMITRHRRAGRMTAVVLAIFWLWNGIAYHLAFFAPINPAANLFAPLFLVQALLFIGVAALGSGLPVSLTLSWRGAAGAACIAYALLFYNLIGVAAGHGWPGAPMFGVAPCPTTIFTIGLLLLAAARLPIWLLAIPVLWAAIGTTAAVLLNVPEDLGLAAAAVALVLSSSASSRRESPG